MNMVSSIEGGIKKQTQMSCSEVSSNAIDHHPLHHTSGAMTAKSLGYGPANPRIRE